MTLYISRGEQKLGPYTLDQAQAMATAGTLTPTDWAWYEGLATWVPLFQIPGLHVAAPPAERPVMVWIISLFYFVSLPLGLVGIALGPFMVHENFPMLPAQRAYFDSLGIVDYSLSFLGMLINLVAAILLFRLKRGAFYLFLGSFVLGVGTILYNIVAKNWLSAVGVPGAIGGLFGYGLTIALLVYVGYLFRKGVLR